MVIFAQGRQIAPKELPGATGEEISLFAPMGQMEEACRLLGIDSAAVESCHEYTSTRYDYASGFDFLLLNVPDYDDLLSAPSRVEIYLAPGVIAFFHQDIAFVDSLVAELRHNTHGPGPHHTLYRFFAKLVESDTERLDDMEEAIGDLEDSLVSEAPRDCTEKISVYRRQLLVLKRYYDALYELMDDMQDNPNGLFTKAELRTLRAATSRVDRLGQTVVHLRDYVTQVRESYQNQMDISLNETMKLLTVVTAVFSPLTLIVGWYGMNLQMPEYGIGHAYPVVILVSLAIIVFSVVFFKRKNWF